MSQEFEELEDEIGDALEGVIDGNEKVLALHGPQVVRNTRNAFKHQSKGRTGRATVSAAMAGYSAYKIVDAVVDQGDEESGDEDDGPVVIPVDDE